MTKKTLTNGETWIRFAYMLLFTLLLMAARLIITIVAILQLLIVLFSGADNENLRNLGQGLGKWVYQTVMFLTFNSNNKPFPFDEWPELDPSEGYSVSSHEQVEDVEFVEVEEAIDTNDVPSLATGPSSDKT